METDEPYAMGYDEDNTQQRPTRPKRMKKSVNESLEPAHASVANVPNMNSAEYYQQTPFDYSSHDHGSRP